MKTLRFELPVLDLADAPNFLDLVTSVQGVVAAAVDAPHASLEVVVSSEACALLVKEEVVSALYAAWPSASAA